MFFFYASSFWTRSLSICIREMGGGGMGEGKWGGGGEMGEGGFPNLLTCQVGGNNITDAFFPNEAFC